MFGLVLLLAGMGGWMRVDAKPHPARLETALAREALNAGVARQAPRVEAKWRAPTVP